MSYLLCYRYHPWSEDDVESIWQFVQTLGGDIELRRDSVDFYVPEDRQVMLLLKYPQLTHIPALDYLV